MSCTPLPKAAKPVWAKQLNRLPCLLVCAKFNLFILLTAKWAVSFCWLVCLASWYTSNFNLCILLKGINYLLNCRGEASRRPDFCCCPRRCSFFRRSSLFIRGNTVSTLLHCRPWSTGLGASSNEMRAAPVLLRERDIIESHDIQLPSNPKT